MSADVIAEYATIVLVLMVKNRRAFTFIELLVSVSVIILFSSMVLAYYNQQTAYKRLDQDTDKLIDVLELAKKKAIAGDVGTRTDCNFYGYTVTFAVSNTAYTLWISCKDGTGTPQYYSLKTYQLTNAVEFTSTSMITFLSLTGSNNQLQTIILKESSLGPSKAVTISINYGNISRQ